MKRDIKQEERHLIFFLLKKLNVTSSQYNIPSKVTELNDGDMGSLQLSEEGSHHKDLIQMEYIDVDSQKVIITLTENQNGELFELDIWKVDFSPLKLFPIPGKLRIVE